jgi:hypothetical protein
MSGVVNVVEPNMLEKKIVDPVNVENTIAVEHVSVFAISDVAVAAIMPGINVLTCSVDTVMYPSVIEEPVNVLPNMVEPIMVEPNILFPASVLT